MKSSSKDSRNEVLLFISEGHQKIKNIFLISEKFEAREFTPVQNQMRQVCISARKTVDKLEENPLLFSKVKILLPAYLEKAEGVARRVDKSFAVYLEQKEAGLVTEKQRKKMFDRSKSLMSMLQKLFDKLLNSLFSEEIMDLQAEIKLLDTMIIADGLLDIE